jgi:hypothetical protein
LGARLAATGLASGFASSHFDWIFGLNGLVLDGLLSDVELMDRVALWMSWMEVDEGGRAVYKVVGSLCYGSEINSLVSADRGASFCAHVAKRITGSRINNS